MKSILIALTLLVAVFGLTTLALASETVFDSKSYLHGEAGVIAPIDKGESMNESVTVPVAVFDGNYWYRFDEQKDTNLTGPTPDFAKDYVVGEAGIVNPIELPMEK